MQLVELLVQGVAGFPASCRIPLSSGHVVVRTGGPLLPLLRVALFADGGLDDFGAARLAAPGAPSSRVGLLLRGPDGSTHRLVRDLRAGAQLHRWDGKAFVPVATALHEILPALRMQLGLPSRGVVESTFWLSRESMPSAHGLQPEVPAPSAPAAPPVDETAVRAQIAALRAERAEVEKLERLQSRVDELVHEQAAVSRRLEGLQHAEAAVESAREQFAPHAALGAVEADAEELQRIWQKASSARDEAIARLDELREVAEARAREASPLPLVADWRFWAAAAAGVVFLAMGLFSPWPLLALLDVPAFGVAAALAYRWVDDLQALDTLGQKRQLFAERQKTIDERFEQAVSPVRKAMEAAKVAKLEELAVKLAERQQAEEKVRRAEEELASLREKPEFAGLPEARRRIGDEIAKVEAELQGAAAGVFRSVIGIDAEIASLEAKLAERSAPRLPSPPPPRPMAAGGPDPVQRLLESAAELLVVDRNDVGALLQPRASHHLATLTDRRFGELQLSPLWGLRLGDGQAWGDLQGHDRDLAWLAVQLSLLEQVSQRQRCFVFYDEPFAFLDDAHQLLVARTLQALGRRIQVLHRTTLAAFAGHADAVADAA